MPIVAQEAPLLVALSRSPGGIQRISHAISAAIVAGLPSFDSLKPQPEHPEVKGDGVIRMPKFVVYAATPLLSEPVVIGKSGLALLLRHQYPGASVKGQDPYQSHIPNYAALMYRDDVRLARIKDFEHLAEALKVIGKISESNDLLKEMHGTVWRRLTPLEEAMDRSYNGNRR
jgi:hypothetical protein